MKKIFIIGGHLSPAIAVIDEIQKQKLPFELVFLGRKKALEGGVLYKEEYTIAQAKHIRFISIIAGRLQRILTPYTIWSFCKIPIGFFQAMYLVLKEKPDCVVSFGGYLAVPVTIASWICRVPVITHEQTNIPGIANRIIARFSNRICITFPSTQKYFPTYKTVLTGLPIRKEILETQDNASMSQAIGKNKFIYVTGGSTGSESINTILFPHIQTLVLQYVIVHQVGHMSYAQAMKVKQALPSQTQSKYIIAEYFAPKDAAWLLKYSQLVVSRAGANVVTELAYLRKKALLIPLPWSGAHEQEANAEWLEKQGLALVVDQNIAQPLDILTNIKTALRSPEPVRGNSPPVVLNGATAVVLEIQKLVE